MAKRDITEANKEWLSWTRHVCDAMLRPKKDIIPPRSYQKLRVVNLGSGRSKIAGLDGMYALELTVEDLPS